MEYPKIVAMLGIKNEERWIAKTLESLEEICDSIVILEPHMHSHFNYSQS